MLGYWDILRPVQARHRLKSIGTFTHALLLQEEALAGICDNGRCNASELVFENKPRFSAVTSTHLHWARAVGRRSERTAGDLLRPGEILSYRKLWCCQFCIFSGSRDVGLPDQSFFIQWLLAGHRHVAYVFITWQLAGENGPYQQSTVQWRHSSWPGTKTSAFKRCLSSFVNACAFNIEVLHVSAEMCFGVWCTCFLYRYMERDIHT